MDPKSHFKMGGSLNGRSPKPWLSILKLCNLDDLDDYLTSNWRVGSYMALACPNLDLGNFDHAPKPPTNAGMENSKVLANNF